MEARDRIYGLRDALARWVNDDTHRLYSEQLQMRLQVAQAEDRKHAVEQEVRSQFATLRFQVQEQLQTETRLVLDGIGQQRSWTSDVAKLRITIQQQLFQAIQGVLSQLVDRLERKHGISVEVWRAEQAQRDRLLEQVQAVDTQQLSGIDKQHVAQQEVSRVAMGERDTLLSQLQAAVQGILTGKERHSTLTMQNASTLADHKHRAIAEKLQEAGARLDGWKTISAENQKLLAYQLDTRNNLLVGLYSFVERREDIGPEWKDMSQMIAGLADSAGGWLTPS